MAGLLRRIDWLAVALGLAAFLVRIPNLHWGLPQPEEETLPVRKAFEMWGWDEGRVTFDPKTAGWPALCFYVNLALQHVQYLIGRWSGRYDDRLDFFVANIEPHTLLPAARLLSVIAGTAVVVIGCRLGRRLGGTLGAVVAGLLLAVSPLLVEASIKVAPDILLTLFSALALSAILDVRERGRLADTVRAGVWIGLGAASKYTPVLLVPCLVAAHLARRWPEHRWRSVLDPRLLAAGAACIGAFVVASPYTVLNAADARRDLAAQFDHVAVAGHFGYELEGNGYFFYLTDALPAGLGLPGAILGLAGLILASWRWRGSWTLVLLSFACFFLGLGALRSLHSYYILPALLPLALGAGHAAGLLAGRAGPRFAVTAAAALAALVSIPPAVSSVRQQQRFARPGTIQESKDFIMANLVGPDVYFACEIGGPELPRDPKADFAERTVLQHLDGPARERVLGRPFVNRYVINLYMTVTQGTDLYYDLRHYRWYDYIVISGKTYHRYRALKERHWRQEAFYRDLEQHCELVRHFAASRDRLGPDVWIYRVGPRAKEVLAQRPALTRGFHAPYMATIRPQDLFPFLGFTGLLAARREDWRTADLYLSTLLDVRPDGREKMLLPVAEMKLRSGDLGGAERLCAEALRLRPGDPLAIALADAVRAAALAGGRSGP